MVQMIQTSQNSPSFTDTKKTTPKGPMDQLDIAVAAMVPTSRKSLDQGALHFSWGLWDQAQEFWRILVATLCYIYTKSLSENRELHWVYMGDFQK